MTWTLLRSSRGSGGLLLSSKAVPQFSPILTSPPGRTPAQRRTISLPWFKKKDTTPAKPPSAPDALTDKYLKTKPPPRTASRFGDLSPTSIFEDDAIVDGAQQPARTRASRLHAAAAIDPDPDARRRWQRKMLIRDVRRRGRLSRAQRCRRTERECLSKSHDLATSTKKLMFLARQIAGKPVDEAILQMRFSPKKAATAVRHHLEHARNEAVVRRGMGLGRVEGAAAAAGEPVQIQTKEGKRLRIEDRTRLYVDQAWVGKGHFGTTPDYRARGRVNMMKNPSAAISVLLKEEHTRIRLHEEREAKARKARVWTHLPNRPITAQRQYYSW